MSKDSNNKPKDLNDVEMLIAPSSPKSQPDVHLVANERKQGREKVSSLNKVDPFYLNTSNLVYIFMFCISSSIGDSLS